MTGLFPEATRPTCEENEAFVTCLNPIVEQMQTIEMNPSHRPSVLFSLLTGPPRLSYKHFHLSKISLDEMIDAVKKKILFYCEIKNRSITRWTSVSIEQFRKTTDCEEKATGKCLEFVMEYQRDLPKHLLAEEHLYTRTRSIFRLVTWCKTLYKRTEAHEMATSFVQKLSAAANYDMRSNNPSEALNPFHTTQPVSTTAPNQWN